MTSDACLSQILPARHENANSNKRCTFVQLSLIITGVYWVEISQFKLTKINIASTSHIMVKNSVLN